MMIRATAAEGQFLGVDWGSFVVVFVVAFVAAVAVVGFYSLGLRLLSLGPSPKQRPMPATLGGWVCIGIGAAAVLYGIYLIIPQFHS